MKVSTSTDRRKRAAIYRKAARIIERDEFWWCCNQLEELGAGELVEPFAQYFKPRVTPVGNWWPAAEYGPRVVALCFMAAMVEAGDA